MKGGIKKQKTIKKKSNLANSKKKPRNASLRKKTAPKSARKKTLKTPEAKVFSPQKKIIIESSQSAAISAPIDKKIAGVKGAEEARFIINNAYSQSKPEKIIYPSEEEIERRLTAQTTAKRERENSAKVKIHTLEQDNKGQIISLDEEHKKKIIMWVGVVSIMVIIFGVWIYSFKSSIKQVKTASETPDSFELKDWDKMTDELSGKISDLQENYKKITEYDQQREKRLNEANQEAESVKNKEIFATTSADFIATPSGRNVPLDNAVVQQPKTDAKPLFSGTEIIIEDKTAPPSSSGVELDSQQIMILKEKIKQLEKKIDNN